MKVETKDIQSVASMAVQMAAEMAGKSVEL